ncbi:MAG: RNA-binding domain-containing protein [Desulfurococcaceae archaeon]
MVEIIVEAEIRPTEELEKVKKALSTIVNVEDYEIIEYTKGYRVIRVKRGSISSLEPFRNAVRIQQIGPTVKSYLYKYFENDTLTILLHKQAAYSGKISLIDSERESPLGPVKVEIRGSKSEIETAINYLTSET